MRPSLTAVPEGQALGVSPATASSPVGEGHETSLQESIAVTDGADGLLSPVEASELSFGGAGGAEQSPMQGRPSEPADGPGSPAVAEAAAVYTAPHVFNGADGAEASTGEEPGEGSGGGGTHGDSGGAGNVGDSCGAADEEGTAGDDADACGRGLPQLRLSVGRDSEEDASLRTPRLGTGDAMSEVLRTICVMRGAHYNA